jgi:GTP-binding protein
VSVNAPLSLRFVTSADRLDRLPASPAELAVVGRSNVGKSSLLNALARRTRLAHVSKTPGRTQLLNLFELDDGTTVVDCPGYGYAAVSKSQRAGWQEMIEGYLLGRRELRRILVLVDGEIGPTKLDVQLLDWLEANGLPFAVIATKHDKVKASQRDKRKKELAAGCDLEPRDVIWVSAAKHVGIDRLADLMRAWLSDDFEEPDDPDELDEAEVDEAVDDAGDDPVGAPANDEVADDEVDDDEAEWN